MANHHIQKDYHHPCCIINQINALKIKIGSYTFLCGDEDWGRHVLLRAWPRVAKGFCSHTLKIYNLKLKHPKGLQLLGVWSKHSIHTIQAYLLSVIFCHLSASVIWGFKKVYHRMFTSCIKLHKLNTNYTSCIIFNVWYNINGVKTRGRSPKTFSIGFSAGLSPILVKISVICLNWWELRWQNCHQIRWHFGWRFCHFLIHPIWWFFWGTAWNGEN